MQMPDIQIGLDIATSLSVIGAAIAFVYTQFSQGRKARYHAIRAQRIEQMAKICTDLTTILREGDEIVLKVRAAQAGRKLDVTLDDYTDFCIRVDRYIRITIACNFNVWATEREREILSSFSVVVGEWNASLVAACRAKERGEAFSVPSFDELVNQLTAKVEQFSTLIRQELERSNA